MVNADRASFHELARMLKAKNDDRFACGGAKPG